MRTKNYTKIEDFINDESFINWANNVRLSDVEFWESFIQKNKHLQELIYDAKSIVTGVQFDKQFLSEDNVNDAWSVLENRIKGSKDNSSVSKTNIFSLTNKKFVGIAASIVLLISVFSIYVFNTPATITHKTSYGEVLNLKLPDGTSVTLNSNSTLTYLEDNARKVTLKGEAFFNVVKKQETNAKFWVQTKDLEVEVYGTAFNVNDRDTKTQVFLEEGSVALKLKNGTAKKMIPGDLVSYSYAKNAIETSKVSLNSETETSWKDGSLIFDRTTLESALSKIKNTYGYDIVFEDNDIKSTLLTGAVPTHNIDVCIKTIEKTAQVTIVNKNNKLHIYKN